MRIIYLHQYFNTLSMPGSTRSFEMGKRLVAAGHEVHIVTSWREKAKKNDWYITDEEGMNVHWLPVEYSNRMSYMKRLFAFFKFSLLAAKKAATIKGDVVFATSTPLTIALPAIYASWRQKIPMVFEVRDLWPEVPIAIGALRSPVLRFVARALESFAYKNASHVVALSPGMAEGVIRKGYSKDRVSIIPNSADLDLFCANTELGRKFRDGKPELGDSPIVLYAGTLGRINGVEYFVSLAEKALNKGLECKFVVIGDGVMEEGVRSFANKVGVINKNFFMYSQISKRDLVGALSAAAITTSLVIDLPILNTNSANKYFDGLASGTPVFINYGGWQAELIKRYAVGDVLSRDADIAVDQIQDWLADSGRLQKAGEAARDLAERLFSRDVLAGELERVLLEVTRAV